MKQEAETVIVDGTKYVTGVVATCKMYKPIRLRYANVVTQ